PKTFVPTVPVVQSLRSVQAARTGTLFKFTVTGTVTALLVDNGALSRRAPRKRVRRGAANFILPLRTNATPPLPFRYFFCANALAASAAKEKSKSAPAGTSPLISLQRI